jgi:hypothetical protein
MHVDIDDCDNGMRLLEIGAVVKVPKAPARPDTSARKLDHDHSADVLPTAEMNAPEPTEPNVTYHAVMFHTASCFDRHERGGRRFDSARLGALAAPTAHRLSCGVTPSAFLGGRGWARVDTRKQPGQFHLA